MSDTIISVIIPSFKRSVDLRRCLEAIALQSRPAQEILVVGRQEDAETWRMVASMQDALSALRIVPVLEPGLIAAMNCGLDNASGDLLVFTDDDAEPLVDWLARIEAAFSDPSVGAVGGRDWIQSPDRPHVFHPRPISRIGCLTWYGKLYGNHHCPLPGHTKEVMFLKGVNMSFRRSGLGSYRVDTRLRGSGAQAGTEIDLCLKVRHAGWRVIFDDRILVKHHVGPRAGGKNRLELVGQLFQDICFNNQYLIAKRCELRRALGYFCNERLFGSRYMPGLLAGAKWQLKGDPHPWRRFVRMSQTALEAFRAGRRAKRSVPQQEPEVKMAASRHMDRKAATFGSDLTRGDRNADSVVLPLKQH